MEVSKPRQSEIADRLNVARTTVTKVLNHDPVYRVAPETRELILRTAEEMGYRPRRRRSNNIALVIASDMLLGYYKLHACASNEAGLFNNRLFLVNTSRMPSYKELSLYVNPLSADGVILLGDFADEFIVRFSEIMPTVLIDDRPCDLPVDRIYCNFSAMAAAMAAHLLECGHTRIALIVDTLQNKVGWDAVMGINTVLTGAGIEPNPSLVWEKRVTSPPNVIREILDHPAKPTAIVAMTIEEHLTYLSLLEAMGAQVPNDISYVAWDSSGFASLSHYPDMTRLQGHLEGLSIASVRRLLDRIDNQFLPTESIQSTWRISHGGTCARLSATQTQACD